MDSAKLDELEKAARAATPGPWEIRSAVPYGDGQVIFHGRFEENETIARWNFHYANTRNNIAYIAAASPDTILEMVRELRVLRRALELANAEIGRVDGHLIEDWCAVAERELEEKHGE